MAKSGNRHKHKGFRFSVNESETENGPGFGISFLPQLKPFCELINHVQTDSDCLHQTAHCCAAGKAFGCNWSSSRAPH